MSLRLPVVNQGDTGRDELHSTSWPGKESGGSLGSVGELKRIGSGKIALAFIVSWLECNHMAIAHVGMLGNVVQSRKKRDFIVKTVLSTSGITL